MGFSLLAFPVAQFREICNLQSIDNILPSKHDCTPSQTLTIHTPYKGEDLENFLPFVM